MKRSRLAVNAVMLLGFTVLCLGGMEYLAINIGQPNPFSSNYTVHAVFSNSDGIPTAADVRMSGVVVGKVTQVSHDSNQPGMSVVTLEVTDSRAVPVYTNGFAKVKPKTLLGEKYIDLTLGNAGSATAIEPNGYLPVAQTGKDVSNDEIFNAFDATARKQQQQVLAALDVATRGQAGNIQDELPRLQQVLDDLQPVARMYSADQSQVDHIFVQLNTILQTTADEHQQLAGLLANGNSALAAIAQRDDALIGTLQEASNVATELNTAMAPTVDAQRQALSELAPALSSDNRLLNQIVGPQPGCGNRPCGIDEVFTGTLLGNINYPNDQTTVSSPSGEVVTNEWSSMFSYPKDAYRGGGTSHAALNIVLSFQCDSISTLLTDIAAQIQPQQVAAVEQACRSAIFHKGTGR